MFLWSRLRKAICSVIIAEVLKESVHLALSWNSVAGCLSWLCICKEGFIIGEAVQVADTEPLIVHAKSGSIPKKGIVPSLYIHLCMYAFPWCSLIPKLTHHLWQTVLPTNLLINKGCLLISLNFPLLPMKLFYFASCSSLSPLLYSAQKIILSLG